MSWMEKASRWGLILTNLCNLGCAKCIGGGDQPLGSTQFREIPYIIDPKDILVLLDMFDEHGLKTHIRLNGGEPTILPPQYLRWIIDQIKDRGHYLSMLTNGYKLLEIGGEHLKKFDCITLDDHRVNMDTIHYAKRFLSTLGVKTEVWMVRDHYDSEEASNHPDNKGKRCGSWLDIPTLYDGRIWPCCNLFFLRDLKGSKAALDKLRWNTDKPRLWESLEAWHYIRGTILNKRCKDECFQPNIQLGTRYPL